METPERGPQGDHGQDGRPGGRGQDGDRGERGTTGTTGTAGVAGARGPRGGFDKFQTLGLFMLMLFVFTLLATYVQVTANRSEAAEMVARIDSCERGRGILVAFNTQQEALAANRQAYLNQQVEAGSPDPGLLTLLADDISLYQAGVMDLPDCEALPRP